MDLPNAIKQLEDQDFDRLLAAVIAEQKRRGRKPPLSDETPPQAAGRNGCHSLAAWKAERRSRCLRNLSMTLEHLVS